MPEPITLEELKKEPFATGRDNYGKPRIDYVKRVLVMTDEEYLKEAEQKI